MSAFHTLGEVIQSHIDSTKKGITFVSRDRADYFLSYRELFLNALHVLHNLTEAGVQPGHELVFQIRNDEQFITFFWAAILGGIVPIPVSVGINDEHKLKVLRILDICGSPYLIADACTAESLASFSVKHGHDSFIKKNKDRILFVEELNNGDIPGEIYPSKPDDTAFIQYSSGSTGDPKGVVLTHTNLLANIDAIQDSIRCTDNDATLSWMPLTHDMGLIGFHIFPLSQRINQVIFSISVFITSPLSWFKKTSEYKATLLSSTNFGLEYILNFLDDKKLKDTDLSGVRLLFLGAEIISTALVNKLIRKTACRGFNETALYPVYGLAEATLAVSFPRAGSKANFISINRESLKIGARITVTESSALNSIDYISVGTEIKNCVIRITDDDDRFLEGNIIGNIQIRGTNVTSGYHNNEKATKNAFTKDRWLKTGDIGFFAENRLFVTGRVKDIIIINGQNYYLNDIDRIAEELPQVKNGTVASIGIYDQARNRDGVVLFILFKKTELELFVLLCRDIRNHLNAKIGLSCLKIIPVKKIPRTTSGKLMRFKLKEEYEAGVYDRILSQIESIRESETCGETVWLNLIENQLTQIFRKILTIESVNSGSSFFELGGDSLKAGLLLSMLNKAFYVNMPLEDLFYYPTIRELARYIDNLKKSPEEEITIAFEKEYYPLSPAQKRMYILHELKENSKVYNIMTAVRISGVPDTDRIEKAFKRIIDRHESLRTNFILVDGKPVQRINRESHFKLECFNSRNDRRWENQNINVLLNIINKPFDLQCDLLFRAGVIIIAPDEFLLMMNFHHIISDGTSVSIILREFACFYSNISLDHPALQYKDYSEWFRDVVQKEERIKKQKEYWLEQFKDGIPELHLPADYCRPVEKNFAGAVVHMNLSYTLFLKLKETAKTYHITMFMLLLSCYYILLYKYSGLEDIVVGTPVSGRLHHCLHEIIGLFINTLCLRNKPVKTKKISDFIREVKDNLLSALNNQEYQFEELVEQLHIKRSLNMNPVFNTMFILHRTEEEAFRILGIKASRFPFENETSMLDISFHVFENEDGIDFSLEYSTELFKRTTITTMLTHFMQIAEIVSREPGILIGDIDIVTDEEKQMLLHNFTTLRTYDPVNMTIRQLFRKQAESNAGRTAAVSGFSSVSGLENRRITYKELDEKSDAVAYRLRDAGVAPNIVAGLFTGRSVKTIIGIIAIWKAGGVYLPLDPDLPVQRNSYYLKDTDARVVIVQDGDLHRCNRRAGGRGNGYFRKSGRWRIIDLDDPATYVSADTRFPGIRLNVVNSPEDTAYIIYTSGTKGNPKGAMISHGNMMNLFLGLKEKVYDRFAENLNVCLVASFSFDASIQQIVPALCLGHTLHIMPGLVKKNSGEIPQYYENNSIDISDGTPAFLQLMITGIKTLNGRIRTKYFIIGGEVLSKQLMIEFFEYGDPCVCRIANVYGPTECSVDSTFYEIVPEMLLKYKTIPIGKSLPNVRIYILDQDNHIAPIGIPGELYISGDGVGKGYINNKALTDERFVRFPEITDRIMYRTGDIARFLSDGNIEFIGRKDNQVKIRGYRIEPEEVVTAITQHPGINDAVVVAKEFFPGDVRLTAYILANCLISWEDMEGFMERKTSRQTCRRGEFRVQYEKSCQVRKRNGISFLTMIKDISYSGAALKLPNQFDAGQDRILTEQNNFDIHRNEELTLSFLLPDSIGIEVNAQVSYKTGRTLILTFRTTSYKENIIREAVDKIAEHKELIVFDFRRSEYRIPLTGSCYIEGDNTPDMEFRIKDISHSGISVTGIPGDFPLKTELTLELEFRDVNGLIRIKGRFAWQSGEKGGIKFSDTRNPYIHQLLVNYIKHKKLTVADLHRFLEKRLPSYMIPSIFIFIDSIPVTANGKIDFAALPEPHLGKINGTNYEPPVSEIELQLSGLWQKALKVHPISVNDNFFEIGGDSLKALEVSLASCGKFSLNELIKFPTIKSLSSIIADAEHSRQLLYTFTGKTKADITLLCIPYVAGSVFVYRHLADCLEQLDSKFTLCALDVDYDHFTGQGSDLFVFQQHMVMYANEIRKNIHTPVIIYAHSSGAVFAIELARLLENELEIKTICLGGSLLPDVSQNGRSGIIPWAGLSDAEIKELLKKAGKEFAGIETDRLSADAGEVQTNPQTTSRLFAILRNLGRQMVHYLRKNNDYYEIHKFGMPCYCIVGKNDPLTENYHTRYSQWNRYFSDVKLVEIEKGDHYFLEKKTFDLARFFKSIE